MLSKLTHDLAEPMLRGEFKDRFLEYLAPKIDFEALKNLGPNERYARLARISAERASLFIRPGELIAGSATMHESWEHRFFDYPSISHTTVGFLPVMQMGLIGLEQKVRKQLVIADQKGKEMLSAGLESIEALRAWNLRYVNELKVLLQKSSGEEAATYKAVLTNMEHVPENPARNFHEAVQSLWTLFSFLRLLGNWSGIGRIDQMLGPYLKADLASGRITLDGAREILAHFFVRGTEWTGLHGNESGDKQFYQNIIIGGIDANGVEVTNEVSYLVLDIVEELGISDFPISVRLNKKSPEALVRRTAETIRSGGGIVAWYDEDRVITGLTKYGFPLEDARDFTNDGCWEAIIGGKSAFGYAPFDMLHMLQDALCQTAGVSQTLGASTTDFEFLYKKFIDILRGEIAKHRSYASYFSRDDFPCPMLSLFVEGCIEKGRAYSNRGAKYTINAFHAGGMPDAANALLAIKKLVYDEHRFTVDQFYTILCQDWEGHEETRVQIQKSLGRFGNDDDNADAMMTRIFDDFTSAMMQIKVVDDSFVVGGLSTFGRQIEWRHSRMATADGFKKGAILSSNSSPAPGTARKGPTAVFRSAGKLDYTNLTNGCALDVSLDPGLLQGEEGLEALCSLIKGSLETGIFLAQVNVADPALLRRAQAQPEQFPELTVRVSGWSARFVSLGKDWQDMVIGRLEQGGTLGQAPEVFELAGAK